MYHVPIMANEVLEGLSIRKNGVYLDCTLGGGGHSRKILEANPTVKLFAIDKDADAILEGQKLIKDFGDRVKLIHGSYENVKEILDKLSVDKLDGVLMDLGISSHQIDEAERGFSYSVDAPLDMRMDRENDFSAYDVVNNYAESDLAHILRIYGEEQFASRIASKIVAERSQSPIETTGRLATIIETCVPKKFRAKQGHPAKRSFQAIRIVVNGELIGLEQTLQDLVDRLNVGGRIAILTFHSLEDRIVKQTFKLLATDCICDKSLPICVCRHKASVKLIHTKPLVATQAELAINSRAGSAKLRIAEKL